MKKALSYCIMLGYDITPKEAEDISYHIVRTQTKWDPIDYPTDKKCLFKIIALQASQTNSPQITYTDLGMISCSKNYSPSEQWMVMKFLLYLEKQPLSKVL